MGFIDYQGKKENRYNDVLAFAKAQQEEETRRLEEEKVKKWLFERLQDARYAKLSLNDLMKCIIMQYRKLSGQKDHLLSMQSGQKSMVDIDLIWNDFCISIITKQLEKMELPEDKRNRYYNTFLEKVFKLQAFTQADKHYCNIAANTQYNIYFENCFDLIHEKYFWKWLAWSAGREKQLFLEFVKLYIQMSSLLGYYLYLGIRPRTSEWMTQLDTEKKMLEQLMKEYTYRGYKEPNTLLLQNPLYRSFKQKTGFDTEAIKYDITDRTADQVEHTVPDKIQFEMLLEKKVLSDYIKACVLLRTCKLPEDIDDVYKELITRMQILQESIEKFKKMYQPDMYQFYEYYIPEALKLTVTYLEYLNLNIGTQILQETKQEVLDAVRKLLIAINDTIDEIYKFASIEIKAEAKALESIMSQDGYIDSDFKMN